jgi:hypothetical protein
LPARRPELPGRFFEGVGERIFEAQSPPSRALSIDYGAGTEAVQSGEQDTSTGKFRGTAGVEREGVKGGRHL